jgi:hypothetical protein
MAITYEPIAKYDLASNTAIGSLVFNSIPQTYTDLILIFNGNLVSAGVSNFGIRFNGDSSGSYHQQRILADGSGGVGGERQTGKSFCAIGDIGSNRGLILINIFSYSSSSVQKTVISRGGESTYNWSYGSSWANSSAINSISLASDGGAVTMAAGTVIALYGIKAA